MPLSGAPGALIAYEVHEGPAGAPPLLLIHGFTASSASFVSNIEGLTRHFTVIACDLLGHGGSDAPDDPVAYAPSRAMERLAGLLDELDYESVLVCGHSLGGALALRFALDYPGRVAGVIVINSASAATVPGSSRRPASILRRAAGCRPMRATRWSTLSTSSRQRGSREPPNRSSSM